MAGDQCVIIAAMAFIYSLSLSHEKRHGTLGEEQDKLKEKAAFEAIWKKPWIYDDENCKDIIFDLFLYEEVFNFTRHHYYPSFSCN